MTHQNIDAEGVLAIARLIQDPQLASTCTDNCGCNEVCGCKKDTCCEQKCGCDQKGEKLFKDPLELVKIPKFFDLVSKFDQNKMKTITDFREIVNDLRTSIAE